MVVTADQLVSDVKTAINHGKHVMIRYLTIGYGAGSYYDSAETLVKSGTDYWCSGLHMPLSTRYGSEDFNHIQQGRLSVNDSKLYIPGDAPTDAKMLKISIGSPVTSSTIYKLKELGVQTIPLDAPVYKKLFIEKIGGTGSLVGES